MRWLREEVGRQKSTAVDEKKKKKGEFTLTLNSNRGALSHLSEQSTCSKFSHKKLRERKNADLHIIKDYVEENNNSFLEYLSNSTHGRFEQLKAKLLV